MNYVIIGSGVAGITALKEILKEAETDDKIYVITKDKYPFYYRPRLIETLSGEVDFNSIIIHDENWFSERNVHLRLEEEVVELEPETETIYTTDNQYRYDKLLIATGSHSFVPPIKGVDKDNIFTLRNICDAKNICNCAEESNQAVVVGGGLLGLESAYNLLKAGLDVTVLEVEEWLMPRQLDQVSGSRLQEILEGKGLKFKTGVNIKSFQGGKAGVTAVQLEQGEVLETDMVLLSTGIRCNHGFAQDIDGLKIDKGIVVNEYMETDIENIYAAGDVANYNNHLYGLWKPAQKQGEVAGKNMIGKEAAFSHFPPSQRLKVVGVNVVSIGDINNSLANTEEFEQKDGFQKVFKNEKNNIKGFISIGNSGEFKTNHIINEIQNK